jgi:hypothetical protein
MYAGREMPTSWLRRPGALAPASRTPRAEAHHLARLRITEGARRGPPEDVGGPWGHGEFLEAIADPKHECHKELLQWSGGGFDLQQFDIDEINRRLASLAPRKTSRHKTTKRAAG